jgi:hypothetical protein
VTAETFFQKGFWSSKTKPGGEFRERGIFLAVVRYSFLDGKGTVQLFQEKNPEDIVGKGHF